MNSIERTKSAMDRDRLAQTVGFIHTPTRYTHLDRDAVRERQQRSLKTSVAGLYLQTSRSDLASCGPEAQLSLC